jgi:hypothetical protein
MNLLFLAQKKKIPSGSESSNSSSENLDVPTTGIDDLPF